MGLRRRSARRWGGDDDEAGTGRRELPCWLPVALGCYVIHQTPQHRALATQWVWMLGWGDRAPP